MLTDSHVHLNYADYSEDVEEVIARAAEWGVRRMLVPGFDRKSSEQAVKFCSRRGISASVGIHPHDAAKMINDDVDWMREQLKKRDVVALGEIGLDYYRDLSPRHVQQDAFRRQIVLAKEAKKPIIIHNREAGADTLRILGEEDASDVGGVFHCFSEDLQFAYRAMDLGFYIGVAGTVTYKSAQALQHAVKHISLNRLLVETDAPFLAPQKFRGKRNEPAYVKLVAEKVAELKGVSFEEVAAVTTENAARIFSLPDEQIEL